MARRMSAIEKLARDICWHGFSGDPKKATKCRTAGQYWKKVVPDAKQHYMQEAWTVLFWAGRLGLDRIQRAGAEHIHDKRGRQA